MASRKRNVTDVLATIKKEDGKKTLFVRVDFNVPMKDGVITDDSRIRGALPTIKAILDTGSCNVVLASHMGRPKLVQSGEDTEEAKKQRVELSLKPVAEHLSKLLEKPVLFADDCLKADDTVKELGGSDVCLLENLRFYKQEEKNDPEFAKKLASYADGYINDAFGTCHRAHASVSGVPGLLSKEVCGIGLLVKSELEYLDFSSVESGQKIAAIIGGSKVSTKLPVINGLLKTVDTLILCGGLAFTFTAAQGISIGKSLVEESMVDTAKDLMAQAKKDGKTLVIPVDAVCSQSFPSGPMKKEDTKLFELKEGAGVEGDWMGLDVGAATVKAFEEALKGHTKIVFNGPPGVFEIPPFDEGTRALIDVLDASTKAGAVTVVGGGDSVAALETFKKTDVVSYVSTGGGATLELLAGDILPGVAAISCVE